MAAVIVRRRRLNRQVHQAELLVDSRLIPDTHVAVGRPRAVLPCLVAELAGSRNGVEPPYHPPGPHVEGADHALRVVMRRHRGTFAHRRAYDRDVAYNRRRRVDTDLARLEIDLLVGALDDANLQVDDAIRTKGRNHRSRLRVQRDEAVSSGDIKDAFLALSVGPVGDAAARELPGRVGGAPPLAVAVRPDQLAVLRIEGD